MIRSLSTLAPGNVMFDSFKHPESCGVDACGTAMTFASIGLFWSLLAYLAGVTCAAIVGRFRSKR